MLSVPPRRPPRRQDRVASVTLDPLAESRAKLVEYEKALIINSSKIDDELIQHPERYYYVAREHALAMSYRDKAKKDLAEAEASADLAVRATAQKSNMSVTEAQVKAQVALTYSVKTIGARLLDWSLLEAQWRALAVTMLDRRRVIEGLVKLTQSQVLDPSIRGGKRMIDQATADRVRKSGNA